MDKSELQNLINSHVEKLKPIFGLGWVFIHPHGHSIAAMYAKRQQEVIKVMTVLPGKYRYEQVVAAINASGMSASGLYYSLCANQRTIAMERFYEALNGPTP